MPTSCAPSRASATIFRYRGSKMCSGIGICGNRTTLGSGKRGTSGGSSDTSMRSVLMTAAATALAAGLERVAAAAGRGRVRILDREAAAHEVFLVVDLGALEV